LGLVVWASYQLRYAVDVTGKLRGVRREPIFSLLLFAGCLALSGCNGGGAPGKPDLPESVSPGWVRKSFGSAGQPAGLPDGAKPECWKALYAGSDARNAEVWACGYAAEGGAFNAVQRTPAAADSVKFQEGKYLVLIHWSGGSKDEVTALVRTVQKRLTVK
jgi:hypothetical protein